MEPRWATRKASLSRPACDKMAQPAVACAKLSQRLAFVRQPNQTQGRDGELAPQDISLLVAGPMAEAGGRVRRALARQFGLVEWADSTAAADRLLPRCHFDCVIVQADSAADPALNWVARLRQEAGPARLILVAGDGGVELAAAARRAGASGCLAWPLDVESVRESVRGLSPSAAPGRAVELVGESAAMRLVRNLIARIAPTPATVLIEGETGTGKELVARLLHQHSGRRGPFVPVNCGAIAPELMESELFGHAKGAFTGAHQLREGLFMAANGGTLFLDEIGSMRRDLQVKLLRALEEGGVRPVGADREVPVDARIVASTQPGLADHVREGRFREDLYYRLNVAHIVLPPLRERPDDVATLAAHFMARVAVEFGMPAIDLGPQDVDWLRSRAWEGNVRELRNAVERAVLMGEWPRTAPAAAPAAAVPPEAAYPLEWTLEQVKQAHILRVLGAHDGNKSAAARQLGLSRKTLERRLGGPDPDPTAPGIGQVVSTEQHR
jgi:DNA-binding NtrC family response regulator